MGNVLQDVDCPYPFLWPLKLRGGGWNSGPGLGPHVLPGLSSRSTASSVLDTLEKTLQALDWLPLHPRELRLPHHQSLRSVLRVPGGSSPDCCRVCTRRRDVASAVPSTWALNSEISDEIPAPALTRQTWAGHSNSSSLFFFLNL